MEILTKKNSLNDETFIDKLSLCTNCINSMDCSLKSNIDGRVSYCEEHAVVKEQVLINNKREKEEILKTFSSLCQTCEHDTNCSLKDNRSIIIECEQYE